MLCQFTFQNFKSYKNETTLDYQAAVLPEFKNTLITETSASDLLPVNVVYGPNGGGKCVQWPDTYRNKEYQRDQIHKPYGPSYRNLSD